MSLEFFIRRECDKTMSQTFLQLILTVYILFEFMDMRNHINDPTYSLKDLSLMAIGKGIWISVFILLYMKTV